MFKELDIQIAVNSILPDIQIDAENCTPDIQIAVENETPDIQIDVEKSKVIYDNDYEKLVNHPSINSVRLIGNKVSSDLGLQNELPILTRAEIREIINRL